MEPIEEGVKCYDQMLIVEKYEKVISYLYPIAQSLPRAHGVARNMFLECLLGQVETAQVLIAEVGRILGAWIVRVGRKGQSGK